jgi:hypothetical protein
MKTITTILLIFASMYLLFSLANLTLNYMAWGEDSRLMCSVFTAVIILVFVFAKELKQ